MNLLVDLKGYDGTNTNTCQARFKRNNQYIGIDLNDETVQEITVPAGDFRVLFDEAEAKKFLYFETTGECSVQINDIDEVTVKPVVINNSTKNGIYLKTSDISKAVIGNDGAVDIKIYYITSK